MGKARPRKSKAATSASPMDSSRRINKSAAPSLSEQNIPPTVQAVPALDPQASTDQLPLPPIDADDPPEWTGTPLLMKLKAAFPRYLWVYFNKAADPPVNTDDAYNFDTKEKVSTRVPKIKRAKEQIDKYPDRPEETLNITNITTSKSKAALRAILEEAPDTDKTMGDSQHLEVEILYPQDETAYSWKKEYLDKLYDALFDVIQEHGLGDEGWRSLRWEVYDKYVVCLKTMCYYPYVGGYWEDKARDWLFGRLVDSGPHSTRSKPALKYQNAVKDAQMW